MVGLRMLRVVGNAELVAEEEAAARLLCKTDRMSLIYWDYTRIYKSVGMQLKKLKILLKILCLEHCGNVMVSTKQIN